MRLHLAFALIPLFALPAMAEEAPVEAVTEQEVLNTLVSLNKRAVSQLRAGHHAEAQKLLDEALVLADAHDLGAHDMAARTHVHLGVLALAQGKHDEGLQQFARAQQIRPDIKLTKQLATAKLQKEFEAARTATAAEAGGPAAPAAEAEAETAGKLREELKEAKESSTAGRHARGEPVEEPDLPVNVPQPLYCPTPMEGPPDSDVRLHCLTQADVRAKKIVLFYRPAAGDQYTPVRMSRTKKGWYSAVIPARQVTGRSLQFYFEARNESNRAVAANGKGDLPNIIVLKPGAPPVGVGALAALSFSEGKDEDGEEDTPLQLKSREDEAAAEESSLARRATGAFWAGLGVGSGYGWHLRRPLERHQGRQVTAGFSPVGLGHATLELGYQVSRRFSLSLQGRMQYLPASGSGDPEISKTPPEAAYALMLHGQYALAEVGDLQLLASLSAGYGSALRMVIAPAPQAGLITSDTVVAGPGVAGPGLGFAYNFTDKLAIALEARSLVGLPKVGVLLEATAGLQYAF